MSSLVLILFGLTAMFGSYMAVQHFRHKPIGSRLPGLHGVLAILSIGFFVMYNIVTGASVVAWLSLGFFVFAAVFGLLMLKTYMKKRTIRSGMIVMHVMLAVLGFIYLFSYLGAIAVID